MFLLFTTQLAMGLTFVVNDNSDDLGDPAPADGVCEMTLGSGNCTLRAAIDSANETPGGPHVVEVPYVPGQSYPVWDANGIDAYVEMTIRGTGSAKAVVESGLFADGGMIRIGESLTVENLEFRPNTTSGNYTSALYVNSPNQVTIKDVLIKPGPDGNNIGMYVFGGVVTCNRCEIKDGQSLGIRIANNGQLNLLNSRISNNNNPSSNQGGAVFLDSGDLLIRDSLIDNNTATGFAPAFGQGGAVYTSENTFLHIVNSTLSGNKAFNDGGGIFAQSAVRLENATITANTADFNDDGVGQGGGLYINDLTVVTAKNSIIHGNYLPCPAGVPLCFPAGRNCDDTQSGTIGIESLGWVMVGDDGNCPLTNLTGEANYTSSVLPQLGPLTLLGGLHPVHPINDVGAEADGGDPNGCTFQLDTGSALVDFPLLTDQRGMQRPLESDPDFNLNTCDIGAYEASCFGDDPDGDYVGSSCDVCPLDFDPLQEDSNADGIGDACSGDLIFYSGFN